MDSWQRSFDWKLFLFLALLAITCFFMRGAETEEVSSGLPVQILEIRKSKAQRSPSPEQLEAEAALFPWANKIENCTVTYYDTCEACCGKVDGITAGGTKAVPYETCAVDPQIIPLGSTVTVEYSDGALQYLRAEDTGSGVKGNHIDICVSGHEEAVELGIQTATIYWNGG